MAVSPVLWRYEPWAADPAVDIRLPDPLSLRLMVDVVVAWPVRKAPKASLPLVVI